MDAFEETEKKTVAVGHKLDLVFYQLRLNMFYEDFKTTGKLIEKARQWVFFCLSCCVDVIPPCHPPSMVDRPWFLCTLIEFLCPGCRFALFCVSVCFCVHVCVCVFLYVSVSVSVYVCGFS